MIYLINIHQILKEDKVMWKGIVETSCSVLTTVSVKGLQRNYSVFSARWITIIMKRKLLFILNSDMHNSQFLYICYLKRHTIMSSV